ncbi:hypothetical protein ACJRO7_022042 [Eucalyptus globulus]|uniref:Uncharacterized protein n=1 Tax=Eucalyptus globulus TaxID=34317 RepID=A0ABD3KRL3_EUCGL
MGFNRSFLAAAVIILVVSAALGGEATRLLTSTYETGENMGRNLESQATPDSYPWADGPVEYMVSGADEG